MAASSSDVVIRVDDVSKRFNIRQGQVAQGAARQLRAFSRHAEEFWALRDVSLRRTDRRSTVGLIGAQRVREVHPAQADRRDPSSPRRASSSAAGRIAALLELGAGFHGDLTGRENVYLNASILGLQPRSDRPLLRRHRRLLRHRGVHRHPGEVLLVGHVRPARVRGRRARRPGDPSRRRGPRRRRRAVPAQVPRPDQHFQCRGPHDRPRHARPRHGPRPVRPVDPARPRHHAPRRHGRRGCPAAPRPLQRADPGPVHRERRQGTGPRPDHRRSARTAPTPPRRAWPPATR